MHFIFCPYLSGSMLHCVCCVLRVNTHGGMWHAYTTITVLPVGRQGFTISVGEPKQFVNHKYQKYKGAE